jgi:hypothetical protein
MLTYIVSRSHFENHVVNKSIVAKTDDTASAHAYWYCMFLTHQLTNKCGLHHSSMYPHHDWPQPVFPLARDIKSTIVVWTLETWGQVSCIVSWTCGSEAAHIRSSTSMCNSCFYLLKSSTSVLKGIWIFFPKGGLSSLFILFTIFKTKNPTNYLEKLSSTNPNLYTAAHYHNYGMENSSARF